MNFRQLKVVTDASAWPVSLVELKSHLRKTESDEDTLLTALIPTATVMVENHTGRSLAARTLRMRFDHFPCRPSGITLWYPHVASISNVKYVDQNGVEQTLDPSIYDADIDGSIYPRVTLAWNQTWPVYRPMTGAIRIEYVTGSAAPTPLKQAIMMMAADLYENRESQITSQYFGERSVIENPTMKRLLMPYTLFH